MKKVLIILLAALILTGAVVGSAAGGSAADPLISLSYINETYHPDTVSKAEQRINEKMQQTYNQVLSTVKTGTSPVRSGGEGSGGLLDKRYKRGDVINVNTGSGVLMLAGSASVSFATGTVVDITDGSVVASGAALKPQHRYLAAENTTALLAVTSDTAVISLEGNWSVSPSAEIDYNALAEALKSMGIFRGSDTGYGSGFDLEKSPTRIEGLILFLRLLGEEEAALSFQGTTHFVDVPDWCKNYVAYAYEKGYTNGVGPDLKGRPCFGTTHILQAGEYVTFLLRALGYQDSGSSPDFTWDTALARAVTLGVITGAEQNMLSSKPFLRAQVAYLSYFGLSAGMKDGSGSLLDHLSAAGVLNGASVRSIMATAAIPRLN